MAHCFPADGRYFDSRVDRFPVVRIGPTTTVEWAVVDVDVHSSPSSSQRWNNKIQTISQPTDTPVTRNNNEYNMITTYNTFYFLISSNFFLIEFFFR